MAILRNIVDIIKGTISNVGQQMYRRVANVIDRMIATDERASGSLIRDMVQSIHHADPERSAAKIRTNVEDVVRMFDTETATMFHPSDQTLNRNLLIEADLKSGARYRIFVQGDVYRGGELVEEGAWWSFYRDELDSLDEMAPEMLSHIIGASEGSGMSVGNFMMHHVQHNKGLGY